MTEYIEREATIDFIKNNTPTINGETTMECVERSLKNVPAADVVEVVRCKDCKQWQRNVGFIDSPNGHCFYLDIEMNGSDFCSYGEKKKEGADHG